MHPKPPNFVGFGEFILPKFGLESAVLELRTFITEFTAHSSFSVGHTLHQIEVKLCVVPISVLRFVKKITEKKEKKKFGTWFCLKKKKKRHLRALRA